MNTHEAPFEIHVHGKVPLAGKTGKTDIEQALKPLATYVGATSFTELKNSFYEEEPGIEIHNQPKMLTFCWSTPGDVRLRSILDEVCENLNDLSETGAALEISIEDVREPEQNIEEEDDFYMLFIGPDLKAIMEIQRDVLINDMMQMMSRHFDASELTGVVKEVDELFNRRYLQLRTPSMALASTATPKMAIKKPSPRKSKHSH